MTFPMNTLPSQEVSTKDMWHEAFNEVISMSGTEPEDVVVLNDKIFQQVPQFNIITGDIK